MNKQNKNKGYPERQESFVTHRGKVELKAPNHYDASNKKSSSENTLAEPIPPPEKKFDERSQKDKTGTMVFIFDEEKSIPQDKKLMKVINEFLDAHPEIEDIPIDLNMLQISKEFSDEFMDFLAKHDVELDEDYSAVDADIADKNNISDEIIEKVQSKRKESSKAKDNARTAKKVGDKEDAGDFLSWIKEPGKSDLSGVDTGKDKSKSGLEDKFDNVEYVKNPNIPKSDDDYPLLEGDEFPDKGVRPENLTKIQKRLKRGKPHSYANSTNNPMDEAEANDAIFHITDTINGIGEDKS